MNEAENPETAPEPNNDLSVVVVSLLRGVLEQEQKAEVWHALLNLQAAVRDYVAVLGLELVLDEAEGYAFLRSRPEDEKRKPDRQSPAWYGVSPFVTGFCRRYGFRGKPERVRFRLLDPPLSLLPGAVEQDITVTADTFARLALPVERVYITENEINFLAFPEVARSMVIFGAGYGFGIFAEAAWLHTCTMHYWGDIDTHGFAILDQLRRLFPATHSFLMDRDTLLAHQPHWGEEPQQNRGELSRLTDTEQRIYDDLRFDRLAVRLRLEQERIGFQWVETMVRHQG